MSPTFLLLGPASTPDDARTNSHHLAVRAATTSSPCSSQSCRGSFTVTVAAVTSLRGLTSCHEPGQLVEGQDAAVRWCSPNIPFARRERRTRPVHAGSSAPIRRVAAACVPSARRTSPRPGTTTTPFGRRSPAGREPPASSPRLGAQKGASATSIPRTAVWCTRRFGLRPLRGTRHKKTRPWFPTHSRISWPAAPHPYPHLAAGFPERGLVAVSPTCGGRPRRADCRHPPRGPNATLCRAHLLRGDRRANDVAMGVGLSFSFLGLCTRRSGQATRAGDSPEDLIGLAGSPATSMRKAARSLRPERSTPAGEDVVIRDTEDQFGIPRRDLDHHPLSRTNEGQVQTGPPAGALTITASGPSTCPES